MPRTELANPPSNSNCSNKICAISSGEPDGNVSSQVIFMLVVMPMVESKKDATASLPRTPVAVRVGGGRADRILDEDVIGHQGQPAVLVPRLHAPP